MPSAAVLLEGKVQVCMTAPNKHTSSLDGANVAVMERRWVVLKDEKLKVYDKKVNIGRKKLLVVVLTAEVKAAEGVYVENHETRELYFSFPAKVCVFKFRQHEQYSKWATICKDIFVPNNALQTLRRGSNASDFNDHNSNTSQIDALALAVPNPTHMETIRPSRSNTISSPPSSTSSPENGVPNCTIPHSSSNTNLTRPHTVHVSSPSTSPPVVSQKQAPMPTGHSMGVHIDTTTSDDVAALKQEVLALRKKTAILQEERDNLTTILQLEKDFVRDRQNKLDSWEHFARIIVFKAVCNSNKNEKLKATLNKILVKNLPASKSIKISRMEVVEVSLPTQFEESPNFGLSNYNEETAIATFNFKWFPQNCTCLLQVDGHKYIGGAIPISFKASIDLLSKLKIKGELLLSKGEGNQFLVSLPQMPELTFAKPSKLQAIESAVFNALKKNLLHPKWKEVKF